MNTCDPNFVYVPETASTNSHLKRLHRQRPQQEATVVYTSHQHAGRGQASTSWEAEPDKNLTFSLLLLPHRITVNRQFILSQLTALAIRDVLSEETTKITIKWPNDIYHRNKKIGGILIENEIEGDQIATCIVGIGLNVNQLVFVGDAPNPVSLSKITGKEYDLQALMQQIVRRILFLYGEVEAGRDGNIPLRYKHSLYRSDGKYYPFVDKTGAFVAKIETVEPTGAIVLQRYSGNRMQYLFKEVTFVV